MWILVSSGPNNPYQTAGHWSLSGPSVSGSWWWDVFSTVVTAQPLSEAFSTIQRAHWRLFFDDVWCVLAICGESCIWPTQPPWLPPNPEISEGNWRYRANYSVKEAFSDWPGCCIWCVWSRNRLSVEGVCAVTLVCLFAFDLNLLHVFILPYLSQNLSC